MDCSTTIIWILFIVSVQVASGEESPNEQNLKELELSYESKQKEILDSCTMHYKTIGQMREELHPVIIDTSSNVLQTIRKNTIGMCSVGLHYIQNGLVDILRCFSLAANVANSMLGIVERNVLISELKSNDTSLFMSTKIKNCKDKKPACLAAIEAKMRQDLNSRRTDNIITNKLLKDVVPKYLNDTQKCQYDSLRSLETAKELCDKSDSVESATTVMNAA